MVCLLFDSLNPELKVYLPGLRGGQAKHHKKSNGGSLRKKTSRHFLVGVPLQGYLIQKKQTKYCLNSRKALENHDKKGPVIKPALSVNIKSYLPSRAFHC